MRVASIVVRGKLLTIGIIKSSVGSSSPGTGNEGPIARTITVLEVAPDTMNPPISTLSPVRLPGSSLRFALNRDRAVSEEEMLMLQYFQAHPERVLLRCTQYLRVPMVQRLTPREHEVLHSVAEGSGIAKSPRFLMSVPKTVERHVGVRLQKVGTETRAAATAEVWRARRSSKQLG